MARNGFLRVLVTIIGISSASAAWAQTDQVTYYHLDAIGSVRMMTNASGQVVERHDYLPFGEEWQSPTPNPERRLFAGKEQDQESGVEYFGARYYASQTGRFTTVDPLFDLEANLVEPQRWNRYAYAMNSPLRYTDPTGLYTCEGSNEDCSSIEGYLGALRGARSNLDAKSDGYQKISAVLNYFGAAGVKNGVQVFIKSLPAGTPAQARDGGAIDVDIAQVSRVAANVFSPVNQAMTSDAIAVSFGAAVLAHEGRHQLDFSRLGFPNSAAAEFRTELNAYWTESYTYEGRRLFSHLWQPGMTPERRAALIAEYAQRSTNKFCSGGRCQ